MCVCILWRLYLVGNPSKLIIISKHDRVDKMSCAPPEPLSHHRPYLRWWTDVALAWTHQSLSVRVGVHLQARTDAPEHTHTSKGSHMWALRRSKHTLELPLTWILYLRPLNICNARWARARWFICIYLSLRLWYGWPFMLRRAWRDCWWIGEFLFMRDWICYY